MANTQVNIRTTYSSQKKGGLRHLEEAAASLARTHTRRPASRSSKERKKKAVMPFKTSIKSNR